MDILTIKIPHNFSFSQCLEFLSFARNETLYTINENKIRKVLQISDKLLLLEIWEENKHIQIKCLNDSFNQDNKILVEKYIAEWFDLNNDISDFYQTAQNAQLLKPLVEKYAGLRIMTIPDLFEAISWAIMGQQINLNFAYTIKKSFIQSFGEKLVFDNQEYYAFPKPEKIALLSTDDLKPLKFSQRKAEYIIEAAKAITENKISKKSLSLITFEKAKEELVKIRGIGNWTANYALMKSLRHKEAFPIEDVGLHNAIKKQLQLDNKPKIEEIKKLSANWNNWYAYSTFYLWRCLF